MDSRKSNRKHKKDRKKKKRRHKSSSSSDSSSSEDEWVEAPSVSRNPTSKKREEDTQTTAVRKEEDNNEWASFSEQFRTRQEIQEKRKPKDKEERVNILDKPGQSARELNPYWADGGSGLPEVEKGWQGGVTSCAVGDFGLDWMRRSLRRAKEQAEEERRSLEDVVAERWGSLAKLESLIAEAEEKQIKNSSYKSRHEDDDKRYRRRNDDKDNSSSRRNRFAKLKNESSDEEVGRNYQSRKTDEYDKWKKEKNKKGFAKPRDDDDEEEEGDYRSRRKDKFNDKEEDDKWKQRKSYAKPRDDVEEGRGGYRSRKTDRNDDEVYDKWKKEKNKKGFARPRDDEEGEARERRREEEEDGGRRREERDWRRSGGWRKKKEEDSRRRDVEEEKDTKRTERESCGSSGGWRKKTSDAEKEDDEDVDKVGNTSSGHSVTSSQEESKQDGGHVTSAVLTADERNELAAKLVKAEIMGNTSLAAELRSRLEAAREAAAAPERVLLTVTDRRGFTQPLEAPKRGGAADADRGRKRPKKAATHDESGQRVRYFADDDRFTLQEMFEREKRNTAEDQNEMFARLAGKKIGSDESARDMDDVFEETAAARGGDARQVARDEERHRARAISQHQRAARAHDSCHWCLESQHLLKHLVVAVGSKVYLCLPPYESLTEGHCLIVTSQHVTCCVQADEEVWEEIQVFRKALVDLFLSQDMDCVLFEHAAGFAKFPHLVVHCVPLPKEQGDLAPIYFKKAILECETEWSTNKKLIDLAGKNVRRCVPRGLPYFFVDFGMQAGYAHVIEDEQLFPRNFAQEIIGGILDVDHSKWRKPRREKFDDQRKKVVEFTKLWKPFDFTKKSTD